MSLYTPHVVDDPGNRRQEYETRGDLPREDPGPIREDSFPEFGPRSTRRDFARLLFKHKRVILATFILVTLLVGIGLYLLPPTYTAQAKILVRVDQQGDPTFFSGVAAVSEPRSYESSARRLETEMGLLEVMPLATDVVQRLGLRYDQVYHSPKRFFMTPVLSGYDRLRTSLFGGTPKDRRGFGPTVGDFRSSITVRPAEPKASESISDIVIVTLRSPDPAVAQRGLSALLDSYMRFDAKLNEDAGTAALRIVQGETQEASAQLASAEQRLRNFLAIRGGRTVQAQSQAPVARGDASGVAQMKARLVELEIDLLNARRIYRPESEEVLSLERQVADLRGRVDTDVVGDASDYSRETQLRRSVRDAENRYNLLLQRLEGISLFLQVNTQQVGQRVVIEPPGLPDSSDWQKRFVMGLGGSLFGLLLGLIVAGAREVGRQTLDTKADVEKALGVETVGAIPLADKDFSRREAAPVGKGYRKTAPPEFAVAFRELAARIARALPSSEGSGRVILVTSARKGEGKSTVANGLAAELSATAGGRVLLVEARRVAPNHSDSASSADSGNGWDLLPDLSWVGGGGKPAATGNGPGTTRNGNDRLSEPPGGAEAFLTEAKSRYSWVILDAASIGDGAGALVPMVDATLLVVAAEKTRREVVRDAVRQIGIHPGRLLGIVLNGRRFHIPRLFYERV